MRAALVQLRSGDDPGANLPVTEGLVREAAAAGAGLVLTPECTNMMSASRSRQTALLAPEAEDATLACLSALAGELGLQPTAVVGRPGLGRTPGDAGGPLRQGDILQRREFRQQVVELVDEADAFAPEAGAVAVAEPAGLGAADQDRARIRRVEEARHVQEGRLAGARGRLQRHHLAGRQGEVDAVEDADLGRRAAVVGLAHPGQAEHGLTHSGAPPPGSAAPHRARARG